MSNFILEGQRKRAVFKTTCYLEGFDDSRQIWRTTVSQMPFSIGRATQCHLVLRSGRVSQRHAELFEQGKALWVQDLGSTNGTFVNGERILDAMHVHNGDVLHFADQEFRLVVPNEIDASPAIGETQAISSTNLPSRLFERTRRFREILRRRAVKVVFQPLVGLADGEVMGYEVLGRGEFEGKDVPPSELFFVAEVLGQEVELSAAFRSKGLEQVHRIASDSTIFVNTHPAELAAERALVESLARLREQHPSPVIVLEIHEAAIADLGVLQTLRGELASLEIHLAFDDFGTGQARLVELIEVEPKYVKFDRVWITCLDQAPSRRLDMVRGLVRMVAEMGIATVAEGIERLEEADVCRELGFDFAQGYYFGKPAPADFFRASEPGLSP